MTWWREPLVHFAVIGALLFALDAWLGGGAPAPADPVLRVTVSADDWTSLRADFEQQWGRAPSASDAADLVREFVQEELLVREARRLGLTADDTSVRRKLAEQMEFLSRDRGLVTDPSDAVLQAHVQAHPERFAPPGRISFTHVLFATDHRGAGAEGDAQAALAKLRALPQPPARAPELGDPFSLRFDYTGATRQEVQLLFGLDFAAGLWSAPPAQWHGPLATPFGHHLVRVSAREPGAVPPLAQIRDAARADWVESQRERNFRSFLAEVRGRYQVTVAPGVPAPAPEPESE